MFLDNPSARIGKTWGSMPEHQQLKWGRIGCDRYSAFLEARRRESFKHTASSMSAEAGGASKILRDWCLDVGVAYDVANLPSAIAVHWRRLGCAKAYNNWRVKADSQLRLSKCRTLFLGFGDRLLAASGKPMRRWKRKWHGVRCNEFLQQLQDSVPLRDKGVTGIPANIIQTSQDGTSTFGRTWREICYPNATYHCFDNAERRAFVHGTRWERVWRHLSGVQQADVFRYIQMLSQGGVYADTDVSCASPLPLRDFDLIVGVESNVTLPSLAKRVKMLQGGQYVQWSFAAKRGHPVFAHVLDEIYAASKQGVAKLAGMDTLNFTGPYAFSRAVKHHLKQNGRAGTLVLPQSGFACGGYSSKPCNGDQFIVHHFAGSWRKK